MKKYSPCKHFLIDEGRVWTIRIFERRLRRNMRFYLISCTSFSSRQLRHMSTCKLQYYTNMSPRVLCSLPVWRDENEATPC